MSLRERIGAVLQRRYEGQPSWVVLVELFIGLGWVRAAVSKVLDPAWWSGDSIVAFVAEMEGRSLPWWTPVLDTVVVPAAPVVAGIVLVGQLVAGGTLLAGRWVGTGLTVGMTMNIVFVVTGAVDPSVFYLILQATIALWLLENAIATATAIRALTAFLVSAVVVVLLSLPFVRTLDPMRVIDDPATVLATYAASIAVATTVARRRLQHGDGGVLDDAVRRVHVRAGEPTPRSTVVPRDRGRDAD